MNLRSLARRVSSTDRLPAAADVALERQISPTVRTISSGPSNAERT